MRSSLKTYPCHLNDLFNTFLMVLRKGIKEQRPLHPVMKSSLGSARLARKDALAGYKTTYERLKR